MSSRNEPRKIKSLQRGHEIINRLKELNGGTLSEITQGLELSQGSIHTYLATLKELGYVVQNDDEYSLGPLFVPLGEFFRYQSPLFQAAKPQIDKITEEFDDAVHLIVEHNGQGIALYESISKGAVGADYHKKLRQQAHQHLHCTASGKAILANLPESRVLDILDKYGLQAQTPNTITQRDKLLEELGTIRSQGYAINDEEEVLGISAVGAAICDKDGIALGAISLSVPETRFRKQQTRKQLIDTVLEAANIIEVNIHTSDER